MTIHSEGSAKKQWPRLNTIRLAGWSLVICVMFSIAMSYWDYHKTQRIQQQKVEHSLRQAANIFTPLLNESLWSIHSEQIDHQMAAIIRFPYVAYAVLTTADGSQLRFGTKPLDAKDIEVITPLLHKAANKNQLLGTLSLYPDFYAINKTFKNDVFVLFEFYLAISGFIGFCIITLCHLLTSKRLRKITDFLSRTTSEEVHSNNTILKNPLSTAVKDEYDELLLEVFQIWKGGRIAIKDSQTSLQSLTALQEKYDALEQAFDNKTSSDQQLTDKEHHFFKAILNALPYSISWRDDELYILGANQAFLDDIGIAEESTIIGTKGEPYTPKERQKLNYADNFAIVHSGYKQINMEERVLLASGVTMDVLANKVPLYDDQGHTIGLLIFYSKKGST